MHKQNLKNQGFTIVELLIVIVIIAILAAISIAAYTGIQNRAKTTRAQTTGTTVINKALAFQADKGFFPPTRAAFDGSDIAKLPSEISFVFGSPGISSGLTGVKYEICNGASGSSTQPAGIKVQYYSYSANAVVSLERGEAYDCTGVDPV